MRHKAETGTVNRRNFLRTASVAPAAAVATAVLPGAAEAYDPGREETKARYRETDHVKAYYRTNGYETLKK
jgi:hypothetical protein